MSDSMKAAHEDEQEYKWICDYFGEDIRYIYRHARPTMDSYGSHSRELWERYRKEQETDIQRCPHCKKVINNSG